MTFFIGRWPHCRQALVLSSGVDAVTVGAREEVDPGWQHLGTNELADLERQVGVDPCDDRRGPDRELDEGVGPDGLQELNAGLERTRVQRGFLADDAHVFGTNPERDAGPRAVAEAECAALPEADADAGP